jgi:esterase/lipase
MAHLVLLHGAIGSKDQLHPLANALKKDFDVHLLNFSGHGGNAFPGKPFLLNCLPAML